MTATAIPPSAVPAPPAVGDVGTAAALPVVVADVATTAAAPLQVTTTGGSAVVAVLVLLGLAVAAGLSLLIAYHALRGYRGTDDAGMLLLAAGIVLLTAAPNVLRIALPTLTDSPESLRVLLATCSELLGLACILAAIYGRPGR